MLGRRAPGTKDRPVELPPERCLNCGALVARRYCAHCGQEHSRKVVSLSRLVAEFLDDTFSLDSKLLKTTTLLLFRPGFLTNEYNSGRRARYLSPWRVYVFTSVLLFFLLSRQAPEVRVAIADGLRPVALRAEARQDRTVITWEGGEGAASYGVERATHPEGPFEEVAARVTGRRYVDAAAPKNTRLFYTVTARAPDGRRETSDVLHVTPASSAEPVESASMDQALRGELQLGGRTINGADLPDSVEEYRAAQARLPVDQRAGWFEQALSQRVIEYRNMGVSGVKGAWARGFIENAPKMMFMLLPLFAFLLKGLYLRRGRLYIEHLVFALHTHAFLFALLCAAALLHGRYGGFMFALAGIYVFAAMVVVYRQSWLKTLAKFSLLVFGYTLVLSLGLAGVLFLTFLTG